jgi:uncharacterized RDD family membrane protein YckC
MRTAEDYIDSVLQYMPPGTPLRKQIALELRGHFAEREANGQSVEEIARQLGDPARLAESYLSAVPLKKAAFQTRMAAKVLDWCAVVGAVLAIFLPVALLIWYLGYAQFLPFLLPVAIVSGVFLFLGYTIVAEWKSGQTVGKRTLGLVVVQESGARISLGQSVVRSLPSLFQVFMIDALFALFTDKHQRAFEMLSKTRVVRATTREA